MVLQRKVLYMILGGLLALGIVFAGATTFAQTDDNADTTETPAEESDGETPVVPQEALPAQPGFGHHGFGQDVNVDRGQALADALGISLEELQAAQAEAKAAAVAQAVTDGLITQEQADAILAGNGRPGHGFRLEDGGQYLADALGISLEDLQAAMEQVEAEKLAAMVEAGVITQEQADMIAARRAVETYVDYEALQATLQAAYEEAINQALADGIITQEQADTLLSNVPNIGTRGLFGGPGFGGPGGRGGHHHGPRGGEGFAPFQNNDSQSTTTDTGLDA
ncbi:MAG: hypothetical protein H6658_04990 [Ardenticatenaceae bacterium]|nr:hypothetical protein [Ardenticatenaceae bacterium]